MKSSLVLFFLAGGILSHTAPVLAHGVKVEHHSVAAIAVAAQYDSGEPMTEAQVLVYAPDSSSQPWLTGVTDEQGKFTFTPPGDRPGNWEVAVRQGGHGAMVTIPWQAKTANDGTMDSGSEESNSDQMTPEITVASVPNAAALSPMQRGITIGAVIWGFVGTALFFSSKSQSHSKGRT
ncbi:carboxypeptidase regulatory-like domain-containing protein [Synechocystis sp. FACHB-383]|uniref:carboxypeptidase-like regulatory domain-containing protein n=1 Tax=Synechocystis sp. FACHB-383 TaxID=2692864 RepID=UPI0016853EF2|nr:carboxypeptidase-like regulatory domain-containing protein [Synechocystis sp. FACHB-383]MBD2652099.1 carboxypeptidase regulatory-like domain-containing protein [Synechocystis sp. FACHB-383]